MERSLLGYGEGVGGCGLCWLGGEREEERERGGC